MVYTQRYSRRRNHRFERPEFVVTMNGVTRRSLNWSLGGVALPVEQDRSAELKPNMRIKGSLGQAAEDRRFDFEGRVVRVDPRRQEMALEFSSLSQGAVLLFIEEFRGMIGGAA